MGTETNANPFAGVFHDHPGGRVTDREDAILGCDSLVANECFEALRHLLGNEDHLFLPAALRLPEDQPPVLHVPWREFQGFAHAQTASGHQLHQQTISGHGNLEDDLIHGLLFQEVPPYLIGCAEELSQHGGVARILEIGLRGVLDQVEERSQGGETGSLGRLLPAVGELGQEAEDFLRGESLQVSVWEGGSEFGQEKLIASDRIFFVNWPCGRKDTALRLFPPSWYTSFVPRRNCMGLCDTLDSINMATEPQHKQADSVLPLARRGRVKISRGRRREMERLIRPRIGSICRFNTLNLWDFSWSASNV